MNIFYEYQTVIYRRPLHYIWSVATLRSCYRVCIKSRVQWHRCSSKVHLAAFKSTSMTYQNSLFAFSLFPHYNSFFPLSKIAWTNNSKYWLTCAKNWWNRMNYTRILPKTKWNGQIQAENAVQKDYHGRLHWIWYELNIVILKLECSTLLKVRTSSFLKQSTVYLC